MVKRDSKERISDFKEVSLGLSKKEVIEEAERCLSCKNPSCMQGCPVEIDIPGFLKRIKEEDFDSALKKLRKDNMFPAICGRVCPQENQCEKYCILNDMDERPINIGGIERFVGDRWINSDKSRIKVPESTGRKIAVIGSGPAGLACASHLAKNGHKVKVFEALHKPGGVLRYGIPEFRLPKRLVDEEIDYIRRLGVEFEYNQVVGKTLDFSQLREDFDAVFIGTGAGLPRFLNIKGVNLSAVYSANEFLTRVNLMKAYRFPEYDTPVKVGEKVAVIGAGNVAMDAARTALRLGAKKSMILYRRTKKQMPARNEEIDHAIQEGVDFMELTNVKEIKGSEGHVSSLICIKTELGQRDDSGRRRPHNIKGSEFELEADTVIMAVGQRPNPLLPSAIPKLEQGAKGEIKADAWGRTSMSDVFAGGDIVTGAATVIGAMAAGKRAAKSIEDFLKE